MSEDGWIGLIQTKERDERQKDRKERVFKENKQEKNSNISQIRLDIE